VLDWWAVGGGQGARPQGPVGCRLQLAWANLPIWENMGNFRYNTGYRKYGQETPSIVFGSVPGHTYPGSRTVFLFFRKNKKRTVQNGNTVRDGTVFFLIIFIPNPNKKIGF
jgi:hypothetical protein